MEYNLRKRFEVAATIAAIEDTNKGRKRNNYFILAVADHENGFREGYIEGAELGYKEAVKEAIKWWNDELFDNYHNARAYTEKRITKEELFEFFEKEMLNLLE